MTEKAGHNCPAFSIIQNLILYIPKVSHAESERTTNVIAKISLYIIPPPLLFCD